jgi:hypothetical protein
MDPSGVRLRSIATLARCQRNVRFSPDIDQIADAPTRRIKYASVFPRALVSPKVRQCADSGQDTATTEAPMSAAEPKVDQGRQCQRLLLNQLGSTT